MLGPFATASRRTPIHQVSLLSHALIVSSVHNDDNDNARQRGPLWPDRMGPISYNAPMHFRHRQTDRQTDTDIVA